MSWRGVRDRSKNGCVIVDSKIEDMMGERRGETNKKKIRGERKEEKDTSWRSDKGQIVREVGRESRDINQNILLTMSKGEYLMEDE